MLRRTINQETARLKAGGGGVGDGAPVRFRRQFDILGRFPYIALAHKVGISNVLNVSAAEFQRDVVRYQDLAQVQPIAVTRDGREGTVLISANEYERLKRRDREVLGLDDFTEADITALEASRPPAEAMAFDHERQR